MRKRILIRWGVAHWTLLDLRLHFATPTSVGPRITSSFRHWLSSRVGRRRPGSMTGLTLPNCLTAALRFTPWLTARPIASPCRSKRQTRNDLQLKGLPKFGFQLLESFLEYFREAVFDQINLIHVYIQCFGD